MMNMFLKVKSMLFFHILMSAVLTVYAQNDTITVNANNLTNKNIALGKASYLIYTKKGKDLPAADFTFVEMLVTNDEYKNIPTYKIVQKWHDKDTISHIAESFLKKDNLTTLYHKTWWKRTNQTNEVDYLKGRYIVTGGDEKSKQRAEDGLKASLKEPLFVNWHCDLHLFSLLPFKENRVFKINVYDPGFSPPRYEFYEVLGSEVVENISCWVLNYKLPNNMGYQRFWISKSEKIVIKEEDNFKGNFRFKLKTKISE